MPEVASAPDSPSVPVRRSPWLDGTLAALVGVGYGLALWNSPTTWLIAVILLILAAAFYAFVTFRFVRRDQRRPDPSAQRAHGVRLITLFALAYLLTRLSPPEGLRLLYVVGGGLLVAIGGYVVLRWEERARVRVSEGADRIDS